MARKTSALKAPKPHAKDHYVGCAGGPMNGEYLRLDRAFDQSDFPFQVPFPTGTYTYQPKTHTYLWSAQ